MTEATTPSALPDKLAGATPEAIARPIRGLSDRVIAWLFIGPTIDSMQRAYEDALQGLPSSEPFMNIHTQSALDSTVAPEGKHTISVFTQYFPYELAEGTWDERREEIAWHVLKRFAEAA